MQAHLRVSWSPPSRNRHRGRSKDDTDIVAVTPEKKANLRRSAIAANATEAQEISTLHNADLDTIICAVARVVYQYTVRNDSVRIGKSEVRQPLCLHSWGRDGPICDGQDQLSQPRCVAGNTGPV